RLPMFILPPNCIVPRAISLTMSPVFPNFLYFISHTPSAANENCDSKSRICANSAGRLFQSHGHLRTCTTANRGSPDERTIRLPNGSVDADCCVLQWPDRPGALCVPKIGSCIDARIRRDKLTT